MFPCCFKGAVVSGSVLFKFPPCLIRTLLLDHWDSIGLELPKDLNDEHG